MGAARDTGASAPRELFELVPTDRQLKPVE